MKIFETKIEKVGKKELIEYIKKYSFGNKDAIHIVSLNPEIIVSISEDEVGKNAFNKANLAIIDGVGVFVFEKLKGAKNIERFTGVELMETLLAEGEKEGWKVLFVGGKQKLSNQVLECQQKKYPNIKGKAMIGIKNIHESDNSLQEAEIWKVIKTFQPHIVLISFGSPFQEIWIEKNRRHFSGVIVAGVGGAFDMFVGNLPRAPKNFRKIGMEWFWRLLLQPSRWKRQMKLIRFVYLALKDLILC